jgi:hypothetical protein
MYVGCYTLDLLKKNNDWKEPARVKTNSDSLLENSMFNNIPGDLIRLF